MIKQHNGAFLVNETAANDPACQMAMASYMETLRQEERRRALIRAAFRDGQPTDQGTYGTWNISDRD